MYAAEEESFCETEQENGLDEVSFDITQAYFSEVRKKGLLSFEQEKKLASLARQGDPGSRQKMIEHNLRLVVKIANRYVTPSFTLLDLIEEGNLGLMHALEKFDPDRGFRFSTYATWWIKQSIERAIMNQSRTIRLPVHVVKKINAIRREMRNLEGETDLDGNHVMSVAKRLGIDVEQVWDALHQNESLVSLDAPLEIDSDLSLGESIPDDQELIPERILEDAELQELLNGWVGKLGSRERAVIEMRYGFNDNEPMTLEEISHHMGLTRERIRQIQNEALKRLRKQCSNCGVTGEMLM